MTKLVNPDRTYAVRLVPYRLPDLIATSTAWVTEDEKDADTLWSRGFVATTNALGASGWQDDFNPLFEGKRVIIVPDNDKAGWQRAVQIAHGIRAFARELNVLALDSDVKDISDWFGLGHCAAELSALIDGDYRNA